MFQIQLGIVINQRCWAAVASVALNRSQGTEGKTRRCLSGSAYCNSAVKAINYVGNFISSSLVDFVCVNCCKILVPYSEEGTGFGDDEGEAPWSPFCGGPALLGWGVLGCGVARDWRVQEQRGVQSALLEQAGGAANVVLISVELKVVKLCGLFLIKILNPGRCVRALGGGSGTALPHRVLPTLTSGFLLASKRPRLHLGAFYGCFSSRMFQRSP